MAHEETTKQEDKRITNVILNHWNEVKGGRRFPAEADLDPAVLEGVLDNCYLVKAEGVNEGKYNYKFLGKNIMNAYGSDLTKCLNYEKGNPLSYRNKIQQILQTGLPIIDEGQFLNTNGDTIKYRQCLVPLSSDGINIDSILGGMRFIIHAKE